MPAGFIGITWKGNTMNETLWTIDDVATLLFIFNIIWMFFSINTYLKLDKLEKFIISICKDMGIERKWIIKDTSKKGR